MAIDEHPKLPSDKNPTSKDNVEPVPPKILQNIRWLIVYGWRHKVLVSTAALVIAVGWLMSNNWVDSASFFKDYLENLLNTKTKKEIKNLYTHYQQARDNLEKNKSADFSLVEKDINALLTIDPKNGHALYYRGEMRRIMDSAYFTPKSCLKMPLAVNSEVPDAYHNDFHKYLDNEKYLSENDKGGDAGSGLCYKRTKGYCPQRTAWINHLLACDSYAEAMAAQDSKMKLSKFKDALEHSNNAIRLYPTVGFEQCMPSNVLINTINDELKSIR